MSSVYVPANVTVLFKRIVNVVSAFSISTHYLSTKRAAAAPDTDAPQRLTGANVLNGAEALVHNRHIGSVDWPRWATANAWPNVSLQTGEESKIRTTDATILRAALSLPRWLTGNWELPRMFSSHQETTHIHRQDDHTPSPPSPDGNRDPRHRKLPSRDPFRQPNRDDDTIHKLFMNPVLFDPIRTPRYPIVLCHGLYGFDSRGPSSFPSMRMHYWSNVLNILRGKVGADVIVTSVPGTGSIASRAERLDEQLQLRARGRGVNLLAHSMGGLDSRHLISTIRPREYTPLSLTSVSTPHRGSPFMDWCESNIGIGKLREQEKDFIAWAAARRMQRDVEDFSADIASEDAPKPKHKSSDSSFTLSLASLPSSFTTLILSIVDSPAYANLTSAFLNDVFNPATPDDPRVKYWSVAGRMSADSVNVWHPFWLPKMVLDGVEEKEREKLKKEWAEKFGFGADWPKDQTPLWADEREWGNDGLVTIQSAKWGEFLGTMEGADHWEMRGARGIEFGVDIPAIPSLGLGSLPLASSLANIRRLTSNDAAAASKQAQGDGWGFRDWTRFVGAWNQNQINAAERKHPSKQHEADRKAVDAMASASSSPPLETSQEKRKREQAADDHVVKSTTDTLSAVFDWLIERVPAAPRVTPTASSSVPDDKHVREAVKDSAKVPSKKQDDKEDEGAVSKTAAEAMHFAKATQELKDLSAAAVTHVMGLGATTGGSPRAGDAPPSEMKKRMDREDKSRKRVKELASKEDLERFYIALSRKMYDEGL
ncbi:hypothetical protein D9619_007396 [Psilocybe cf. subviscida]|uniref:DUF676 domain-containing protein n=1 Tax=Psilocybe cf. subviscida TaxID=2480587 RepID=A0A8H5B1M9_9AGAR|nr:hypothetical protein D9619_007396 [Psilocybe cf. subviscida]